MARRTNSSERSFRDIPARRVGEEGEKWISYEEQERRREVYARSRAKKARQMEQRRLAPSLAEEMERLRIAAAKKQAARSRAPKGVYTKAYLDAKGMKRRNPLDMHSHRAADGSTHHTILFPNSGASLDIAFGPMGKVRVLSGTGHLGTLVKSLTGRTLTADDVLNAAILAEAAADDMLNAYPPYRYRDAARYYRGLTEVLTDLAATLQKGWR